MARHGTCVSLVVWEDHHAHSNSMVRTRHNYLRAGRRVSTGKPRPRRRVRDPEGNQKLFGRTEDAVALQGCDDEGDEIDHAEGTLGGGENEERRNDTNVDEIRNHDDTIDDDISHTVGLDHDQLGRYRDHREWSHLDAD